ncbi:transmembrane protein, putative (macronuclear) [Tetrahymena thermophila SB210]|uniref:Transmembrane protein, putative n=1 Tax=Tetrahymena thermophila (strain SB210) TaxID=312017 RepID=W7X3L7_TETTS|nr:transmembrane protein, putative [Tetrahymena thermophila SB210]EWS73890.1 transmembrane protein, putative [Tetrahymena thermophila SB210]|eukprot:XP_012653574.1 transmembrane protein, putative [Tetrahymena thermophila SB210]
MQVQSRQIIIIKKYRKIKKNVYSKKKKGKRGSLFGILLSLLIIALEYTYLICMIWQIFTNQIEQTFRSQGLITEDKIDIPLSRSMVVFRFEQGQDSVCSLANISCSIQRCSYIFQ